MKKLLFVVSTLMIMSSCASTKEVRTTRNDSRKEKKLREQVVVREAVESKRFIIKFDRLYYSHGRIIDLIPRTNYIVVDGEKTIISAAYLGRQYDIRPIAGISLTGKTLDYKMESDSSKGTYKIKMKVNKGGDSFNVYLSISENGTCSASVSSMKIDFVRYSGQIVPIKNKTRNPSQKNIMI
jgi:hypothetical protein